MKKTISALFLTCAIFLGASPSIAADSFWKVGRAVVQAAGPGAQESVKLSLRNDGRASREEVRILGRWTESGGGEVKASELGDFSELGRFTREVELKKTAILEVSLAPMGLPRPGKERIQLVIVTGRDVTDSRVVD